MWAMGSGEYDRLSNQTLMRIQQARRTDTDYYYNDGSEVESNKIGNPLDLDPPAIWPADGLLKKGFTRVAILTNQSAGLLMTPGDGGVLMKDNEDTIHNFSPTHVFEVVINAGEAYLKERSITFSADEMEESQGRRILDYSSSWHHNVLILEKTKTKI